MRIDSAASRFIGESNLEQSSTTRNPAGKENLRPAEAAASGMTLSHLTSAALSAPEARMERVESLRAQIAGGTYEVSAEQLAASMLAEMRTQT